MKKSKTLKFLAFMHQRILQLQSCGHLGTARNYEKARRSFSNYLGGRDIPFRSMTENLVSDYSSFLFQKGVSRNSVSFYMRILRAVYNRAVNLHLVKQAFPFQDVYTGVAKTLKRAVDEQVISRLSSLDLVPGTLDALARDIFLFSYCTRGMSFVDVAYLRRSDLKDGMICYSRKKTGQILYVRIEPDIQSLIDRYAVRDPASVYVFPILTDTDPAVSYRQYQNALNRYNRALHRLSEMIPGELRLTSYCARHSWATAARNHNVPITVISAALGHSSERTTQIYLAMLENSVIDNANREIISRLGHMNTGG